MTRQEAMEYYISKHQFAKDAILRLQKWDEKKSIAENAAVFKIGTQVARCFAVEYKLLYKIVKPQVSKRTKQERIEAELRGERI